MGTTYYTLAVFDEPWEEVLRRLKEKFKYTRELAYQRERREDGLYELVGESGLYVCLSGIWA